MKKKNRVEQEAKTQSPEIQRCFDCPMATFKTKQYSICGKAKQLGLDNERKVKSQSLSPTCPLGIGQNTDKKKRRK